MIGRNYERARRVGRGGIAGWGCGLGGGCCGGWEGKGEVGRGGLAGRGGMVVAAGRAGGGGRGRGGSFKPCGADSAGYISKRGANIYSLLVGISTPSIRCAIFADCGYFFVCLILGVAQPQCPQSDPTLAPTHHIASCSAPAFSQPSRNRNSYLPQYLPGLASRNHLFYISLCK